MKISTIGYEEVADYLRITDLTSEDKSLLESLITIAIKFICKYTGLEESDLDDDEDFSIVLLILCQDMYDNRTLYVDSSNLNNVVQTILGMHSRNHIC